MAQARKLDRDNTRVASTEVKKVKKPETMLGHKETKQYKDEGAKVDKSKEVKKEKMTRAQIVEQFQVDIAAVAESNPKLAVKAQKYYEALFQVASSKDFMAMVQSVNTEDGAILLKTGFNLPILPEEDVFDFMDLFVSIIDGAKSPTVNIVKYKVDYPDFDNNIALFTYALFELVGAGRKAHNIEWDAVEAGEGFDLDQEGLYSKMYLLISEYLENGEGESAENLKGALMTLAPNAFEAFAPLFNRESFKKLGITISSPTEGKDAIITPVISEIISYMMFDTFGDYAPIEDEETDDKEEAEVEEKKPVTSQKSTQKPKVEAKPAPVEDEEDEEIEEEETPFDSDEDEVELDEEDEWEEEDEE